MKSDFVESFKQLLKDTNQKQADICKITGIPSSLMSEYINGKKSPAILNAIAIADAFNVSLDRLVGRNLPVSVLSCQESINTLENRYNIHLSDSELEIIKKYRCLSQEGKIAVQGTISGLYNTTIKPKIKEETAG